MKFRVIDLQSSQNPRSPVRVIEQRTGIDCGSWGGLFRVAIVGAGTLKGREIKDVLSERNFPSHDVRLLDDDESLGQLEAIGDEPTFIQSVLPEHMENVDFTFFAADEKFTKKVGEFRE